MTGVFCGPGVDFTRCVCLHLQLDGGVQGCLEVVAGFLVILCLHLQLFGGLHGAFVVLAAAICLHFQLFGGVQAGLAGTVGLRLSLHALHLQLFGSLQGGFAVDGFLVTNWRHFQLFGGLQDILVVTGGFLVALCLHRQLDGGLQGLGFGATVLRVPLANLVLGILVVCGVLLLGCVCTGPREGFAVAFLEPRLFIAKCFPPGRKGMNFIPHGS